MHTFYLTNNLGGGGTNVSRYSVYQGLLNNTNQIGLLLNYYYLSTDIAKTSSFDGDILRTYNDYKSISAFLDVVRQHFIEKERIVTNRAIDTTTLPIKSYLLDSGIGNILRDLISNDQLNTLNINNLIEPYHKYGENLKFDILIALDYALKYTYKKGERLDENLKIIWEELANNQKENLLLIEETVKHLNKNQYSHKTYAPLHGFNFDSFLKYGQGIKDIETLHSYEFDGYALGGIANANMLKNDIWQVPEGLNKNQKSTWIVSNLCKQTKQQFPKKPLHVLGAGSIYAIPFLTKLGADSSDCHSPWRRASDGNSKILVPLFDKDLNFFNNSDIFEYKKIADLDKDSYAFSLPLSLTIEELKELYISENREDYYLAQLVIFFHAINQYDLLNMFMQKNPGDYIDKLCNTPDIRFNEEYKTLKKILL